MDDATSMDVGEDGGLSWVKALGTSRWLDSRRVKLGRVQDHATRALGLACILLGMGPALRHPWFHRALRRLGVLEFDTREAKDSPLLDRLPWGAKTVDAPQPRRPAGVDGMWPQPPFFHPDIYPGVLHVDRGELVDHVRLNALRYMGQIVALTPGAAWRARARPRVWPLDDAMFSRILTETSLAQHLRFTLTEGDRAAFAPFMEGGFPDGRRIFDGDSLGGAVGRYLATITVLHSGDHYSYSRIPIEHLPMRIRVPFPDGDPGKVDIESLVSAEDFFRHVLCHRMFFAPVVTESLDEVRYSFDDEEARRAATRFRDAQARLDERWRGSGFPASYEIASSIQY